jgi:hypothetical protein
VLATRGLIGQTPPPRWDPAVALHCISPVGGCDRLVGGLHRRPSSAGYHNDEQNHEENHIDEIKDGGPVRSSRTLLPPGWIDQRRPLVGLL